MPAVLVTLVRSAIVALAAGGLAGCVAPAATEPRDAAVTAGAHAAWLLRWQTFVGGPLYSQADPGGMPLPGAAQRRVNFVFPTAVAANGVDVYVADSGAGVLYRMNATLGVLGIVPGIQVSTSTRIAVAADRSLLVLDTARSEIRRYTADGHPLQTLADPLTTARLSDFAIDPAMGRIYAVDGLAQRLLVLFPGAQDALPLASAGPDGYQRLTALAVGGDVVFAIDQGCSCVAVLDDRGQVRGHIGAGELTQPVALATDPQGRIVYVADGFDQVLGIYDRGLRVASLTARELGLSQLSALALDGDVLYVADAAGARVAAFRARPTPAGPQ